MSNEIEEIEWNDALYYPNGKMKSKNIVATSNEFGQKISFLTQSEMDTRQEMLRKKLEEIKAKEISERQKEHDKKLDLERKKWLDEQLKKMGK